MKKRIINKEGDIIFSSIDDKCMNCIHNFCLNGYASHKCEIDNKTKRLGYSESKLGSVFACSENSNTTKNFKLEVEYLAIGIKYLEVTKNEIVEATINDEQERVHRLIHNLKSLNAHCIQELYSIVPQNLLIRNISETLDIVQDTIKKRSREAAKGFLRIAKYNTGVKAEFSIYDKLLKKDVRLSPRYHNLRDVFMLVLHMFFGDFAENHVYVEVDNYYEKAYMDFESVHVALYHIIENSTKYVCPNTKIEVHFRLEGDMNVIIFSMKSLFLYPEDVDNIFKDGYSGILAKKTGKAGHGLGMYRAKQLLIKNNSSIDFIRGTSIYHENDIDYADNKILVKIPRIGY